MGLEMGLSPDLLKQVRDYAAQTGKSVEDVAQMALFRFVNEPYREPSQKETDDARGKLNAQWNKDITAFDAMTKAEKTSDERVVRELMEALRRERTAAKTPRLPLQDGLLMKRIFLDAQVLALLSCPQKTTKTLAIRSWLRTMDAAGHVVYVPEVADYEVRRELLRAGREGNIANLDTIKLRARYVPTSTPAMLHAAELWARMRRTGAPDAPDIDVILAAQILNLAATYKLPIADFVIATVDVGDLSRFGVAAREWQIIAT